MKRVTQRQGCLGPTRGGYRAASESRGGSSAQWRCHPASGKKRCHRGQTNADKRQRLDLALGFPGWPLFLPITFSGRSRLSLLLWTLQYPSNKFLFQPQLFSPILQPRIQIVKNSGLTNFQNDNIIICILSSFTRMKFLLRIWEICCQRLLSLKDILETDWYFENQVGHELRPTHLKN